MRFKDRLSDHAAEPVAFQTGDTGPKKTGFIKLLPTQSRWWST